MCVQVESNNWRIDVDTDTNSRGAEEDVEESINCVNLDVKADRFSPRGKESRRKDKRGKRAKRVSRLNKAEDEDTTDDDEKA